jgi:hypothetical protein
MMDMVLRGFVLSLMLLMALPAEARQVSVEPGPAELRALILSQAAMGQERGQVSRSPGIPFLASAVLPGAGQWINGQRVKALVAVSLEAAIITGYVVTRQNGLQAEDDFRVFAHDGWSPTRYASWLNDYREYLNDELGASITAPPVQLVQGVDLTRPSAWSAAERALVQQMFNQITAIERQAFHPETGAVFSHQLPDFGDQQYYELIGKYFQFAPGWEDYPAWRGADDGFLPAIDPELTGANGSKPNVSATFYRYARDHADAQDLLRQASRISLLLVFNHLIAGIDAAVSAKLNNDRLSTSMGLAFDPQGAPQPVMGVRMRIGR